MKNIKLFFLSLSLKLECLAEYKKDFTVGIITTIFVQLLNIVFIEILFLRVPSINGWQKNHVLLLFYLSSLCVSIYELLGEGFLNIPDQYIKRANLDYVLTKPMNALIYIMIDSLYFPQFIHIVSNFLILIYVFISMKFAMTLSLLCLLTVALGVLLLWSLSLMAASLSFFFVETLMLIKLSTSGTEFVKYPLSIYPKVIQSLLVYIIPVSVITSVPNYIFGFLKMKDLIIVTTFTAIFFFLSVNIWNFCLKFYQASGT